MSEIKTISYEVYPGNSARWFPFIKTVVYVKSDLYKQWKLAPDSVKFEDILEDPKVPVLFMWATFSKKRGFIEGNCPPLREREQWYGRGVSDLEIARVTAQKGYDVSEYSEYKKPQ